MNDEAVYRTAPATPGLLKIARVGFAIEKRFKERKKELEKTEVGQRHITDFIAPETVEHCHSYD